MQIPSLPTDNLYKFLALSGVVLALFSGSAPILAWHHNLERMDGLSAELAESAANIEFLGEDLQLARAAGDTSRATAVANLKTSREVRRIHAVSGTKLEAVKRLNRQADYLLHLGLSGMVSGFILAAFGFVLWYSRVQRHEDLILQREALRAGAHPVGAERGSETTT